jgi:23S rRNA (pseudouridine1915-N3)-methyltransferase
LKLVMVAVGQRMPAWIEAGFGEYAKRMPRETAVELVQIRPEPRTSGAPVERLVAAEAKRVRGALPQGSFRVVLDERGQVCTTKALARRLEAWQMAGRDVAFVIGGPDGLEEGLRREADWLWSLTPLTLPHGLVRVLVAEQLYRASSILKNHPYHRD